MFDLYKLSIVPVSELGSGPFKLVVSVPVAYQSREKWVKIGVWRADDNCHRAHVTKHHIREGVHISERKVLYAGNSQGWTDMEKIKTQREQNRKSNITAQEPQPTAQYWSPDQILWGGSLSVWLIPGRTQCTVDRNLAEDSQLLEELIHAWKKREPASIVGFTHKCSTMSKRLTPSKHLAWNLSSSKTCASTQFF